MTSPITNRRWTDAEDAALVRMWNAGTSLIAIAEACNRATTDAVEQRAVALRKRGLDVKCRKRGGAVSHEQAQARRHWNGRDKGQRRKCLGCQRSFVSTHIGHRLCGLCIRLTRQDMPVEPSP